MKTINIKGKDYVPVEERVKEFHKIMAENNVEEYSLQTEMLENTDKRASVKATVTIGSTTFTGHSQAPYGTGTMGSVALEIAETSAIGRALGFANIGLVNGIASADEMRKVKPSTNEEAIDY